MVQMLSSRRSSCLYHHGCHLSWNKKPFCQSYISRRESTWCEESLLFIITISIFLECSRSKWWWCHKWDWTNPQWASRHSLVKNIKDNPLWLW